MKRYLANIVITICLGIGFSVTSCNKILEVEPKQVLGEDKMFQNIFDADAAVVGIYGQILGLAESYVVLNELRADLMTTTLNYDEDLRQINENEVSESNRFVDPRPFYKAILNCNVALFNFDKMLDERKISVADHDMRYSDIAALRDWLYLQLGIQYGSVPFITEPLSDISAINNEMLQKKVTLPQLIDRLVRDMESLPTLEVYPAGTSLMTNVDGYSTNKFFINKKMLLGELYLWDGQYHKAAMMFKDVMESGGEGDLYNYRVTGSSKGDQNDIAVGYYRYRELDENMLVDNNNQGWRSIFARNEDALFDREWVWYLPFDNNFKPQNPFINLFSNQGGNYLVKPSKTAMENWDDQIQKNDFHYDARGKKFTWRMINGEPVIMKYLYNFLGEDNFLPISLTNRAGKFFLYRAASLHLYYAEAANRDRHHNIANDILNQGMTTYPGKITNESFPYDFDARKSDNPRITGDWSLNAGIRGRAYLYSKEIVGDSTRSIEDNIIEEAGLELAYEGRRWPDLVRIAMRRKDPAFLADKVYRKLVEEGSPKAEETRSKLMDEKNWFLPFNWDK